MNVTHMPTEVPNAGTRSDISRVCIAAHNEEDFHNLFAYIPTGGRHFLAYDGDTLVSHAVVTTRWLQPEGMALLKTAYVDAVGTLPAYEGLRYGTGVMRYLAENIPDYEIACLETEQITFYERPGCAGGTE